MSAALEVGKIVEGKVTGITKFGVFVEIEKGVTGLVHISEVSTSFVNDINEHVKIGDQVKVKILQCADDGKISLSMRRAMETQQRPRPSKEQRAPRVQRSFAGSYDAKPAPGSLSFEDMMAKFKQSSDEKFVDLKRKNGDKRISRKAHK